MPFLSPGHLIEMFEIGLLHFTNFLKFVQQWSVFSLLDDFNGPRSLLAFLPGQQTSPAILDLGGCLNNKVRG